MKVLKRLLWFFFLLVLMLIILGFATVYYSVNERHIPYIGMIEKYSKENQLDEELVAAIIKVESGFDPKAVSHADAMGLMQLVPDTAKWVADKFGEEYDSEKIVDPETNIKYGTYYFKYLLNHYHSVDYAILAYNGGIGNVDEWIKNGILTGNDSDYSKIPFAETKNYIRKVKSEYHFYKNVYKDYYKDENSTKFSLAWKLYLKFIGDIFRTL